MFQIGEAVIHPGHGPGKVVDIKKLLYSHNDKWYYKIKLLSEVETIVWIPVQDAEEKGIRRPIPSARLSEVWRLLRAKPEELPSDHKERYAYLREKLENGNIRQIAEALRDLSWKDYHVRSLTIEGKRWYDKGMKLLAAEIALIQSSDPGTVAAQISSVLDQNAALRTETE